jgi:FkbM family methyltransferase
MSRMLLSDKIKGFLQRRIHAYGEKKFNRFLDEVVGVIHVGANLGQEREYYAAKDLEVLWVEPIPEVYEKLVELLRPFPKQKAVCRLVTDEDQKKYIFNIADNGGASSSILEMKDHHKLWPEVSYTKSVELVGVTLEALMKETGMEIKKYQALILDTQGSEKLVLEGAAGILHHFKYIKVEVADFESYKGGVTLKEMDAMLEALHFTRTKLLKCVGSRKVGYYYEALYANQHGMV